ncbi:hypothetical protein K435DRAFT_622780, partial [Dendrothele bispora CBS 962.96]
VTWTPELSQQLVNCILEDATIKNGLYPGPGGNQSTANGGGLSKVEHYFNLFEALFGE